MDEHAIAKHGHFAEELEALQRLGVPAEPRPGPDSTAWTLMAFAAMQSVWGGLILGSAALRHFGLDILLFNEFAIGVVMVLFVVVLNVLEWRRPVLPEPRPLRGMSDVALRRWRGVFWFVALASFLLLIAGMTSDRDAPLLVEARESGDLRLLVTAGLAFLAVAGACVPLILCQIAVEARQRSD